MPLIKPEYNLSNFCKISLSPFDEKNSLLIDFSDYNFIILAIISTGKEYYGKMFLDKHLLKRKIFFFKEKIYLQNNIKKAAENITDTSMFDYLSTCFFSHDYNKEDVLDCIDNQKDDLILFLNKLFQISLTQSIELIKQNPKSKNFLFHQDINQIEIGDFIIQGKTYKRLLEETNKLILKNYQKNLDKFNELSLYQEELNFVLNKLNNKNLTKNELFDILVIIDKELDINLYDILRILIYDYNCNI